MKTTVKKADDCPSCGRPLPVGALKGLCPACLLAQGADADTVPGEPPAKTQFQPWSLAEVGELFPQLEFLSLLGVGGMGAVYKARQPALDRMIALKILPAGGAGGGNFAERFNREARALARLRHPNIVAVHEFGEVKGLHFFIMEFVDGANLRQLEKTGRLSPREALQLIPQICDALQYAHDEGVVHRDIKPENVLVDRKGRVRIADFGLAKILGVNPESLRLTAEGQIMGTPHYMAPEQVERPLTVDHRADIYSLGVVLYEMLTGDLPLGKFSPPSRKIEVDVRFDEVVLRALENDPARRYQQVSEVKSRVETIAETPEPTKASTLGGGEPRMDPAKPGVRYLRWAGIPAVVERDGEREVHFQGALGVFFVTMMTSGLAQLAVRWGTGDEYSMASSANIAGVMMGIWAIRRTMNQPWGDEPLARNDDGTVITPPTPRRRYAWDTLMMAGLAAFVIGIHFLKLNVLNPMRGIGWPTTAQSAVLNKSTGTMIAALPGGGTMELLGLGGSDPAPNQWWRPDGRPISNSTLEIQGPGAITAPNSHKNQLAFRIAGVPGGSGSLVHDFDPPASMSAGGQVLEAGRPIPDGWPMRVAWASFQSRATVRLGYTGTTWRTVATHDLDNGGNSYVILNGDPKWIAGFNHVADVGADTILTMVLGPDDKNWAMRVVAVDTEGRDHEHRRGMGTPAESSSTWTLTFEDITKARIKQFRVEVRPVHWVAFRNVLLEPTAPLPAPRPARFAEVVTRAFDELIDFDTGKTSGFPTAHPGGNPLAGIGEAVLWMKENGFDAAAGVGELQVANMEFVALENGDWETLTVPQLIDRLHNGSRFAPRDLRPAEPGLLPSTFAFRTRERGMGLLQLVAFNKPGIGATVRYKLVENPAAHLGSAGAASEDRSTRGGMMELGGTHTETKPETGAIQSRKAIQP